MKKAVRDTLKVICDGRVVLEIAHGRKCGYIHSIDGTKVCDPEFPDWKIPMPGVWLLYRAGYIDQFGVATNSGRIKNERNKA